jgi:hypothetical protein
LRFNEGMNTTVKRLVLDILKPHEPNALEFARALAALGCRVQLRVDEVDEKTETLVVTVEGDDIDFDLLRATVNEMGGSLHSIDEVEVHGTPPAAA